jgi:phosphatidylinositol alpha-mannosyltransferase
MIDSLSSTRRPLRIGLVCPYAWDVPGGVQAHIHDLAETLIGFGHDVSVLTPVDDPMTLPEYAVDGGRPRAIPYNGSVARLTLGVNATRRVHRWIKEGDFDVVHVHEPVAPSLSVLACWVARGPIVATWHSSMQRSRALSAGYYLAQTALEKVSARIAVSENARRTLVDHLGGDAVLIPNGVRIDRFAGGYPASGNQQPTLVFLGRIDEPRKGLSVLLQAWPLIVERHPEANLVVIGPGDIEQALSRVEPRLRGGIRMLGRIDESRKATQLASADLYVAPNTGGESFGIVLLESMAAGTAVLASDLVAFERVLDGGRAGALFITGDADDLAAKANELLSDSSARRRLEEAGRERVQQFDWAHIARQVEAVYDSVTVSGETVQVDLRGQIVGRLGRRVSDARIEGPSEGSPPEGRMR